MNPSDQLFRQIPEVRYVAVSEGGNRPVLQQRPGIAEASGGDSDMYEELLVNPAILLLAKQRGDIDCGGLEYVLIRYGNFYQLVYPTGNGHFSVAIEPNAGINEIVEAVLTTLRQGR